MNARAILEQIKALPKHEQAEALEMVHRLEDDAIRCCPLKAVSSQPSAFSS